MSVTVEDVMKLPSMKHSTLLAGKQGLNNVVYGVTVAEFEESEAFQDEFYRENEGKLNSQIALTSFSSIKNNVDLQCHSIERLSKAGQVGLVIYYVGKILQQVDRRLVETAESLGFPLIIMPQGTMGISYSDLITEINEAVLMDRLQLKQSLVTEIISQVSRMPAEKQTIDTVLSLICNKLHVSVVLTDANLSIMGFAPWPLSNSGIQDLITEENVPTQTGKRKSFKPVKGNWIWYEQIYDRGPQPMKLLLIEEGETLNEAVVDMAKQTVQLAVELWSNTHSAVITAEFVKAIFNDEPIRMRRLAEMLHIDIASINNFWMIRRLEGDEGFTSSQISSVREIATTMSPKAVAEPYHNDIVVMFKGPVELEIMDSCASEIVKTLEKSTSSKVCLTTFDYKYSAGEVRSSYLSWNKYANKACTVFPLLKVMNESHIQLVSQCVELISQGEKSIEMVTRCIKPLEERQNGKEFIKTLEVFFLDASMSMQNVSELINVHKNTIKYRINMACDTLGYDITTPAATVRLTLALCIKRLLEKSN